jgi:hypothetical protein
MAFSHAFHFIKDRSWFNSKIEGCILSKIIENLNHICWHPVVDEQHAVFIFSYLLYGLVRRGPVSEGWSVTHHHPATASWCWDYRGSHHAQLIQYAIISACIFLIWWKSIKTLSEGTFSESLRKWLLIRGKRPETQSVFFVFPCIPSYFFLWLSLPS